MEACEGVLEWRDDFADAQLATSGPRRASDLGEFAAIRVETEGEAFRLGRKVEIEFGGEIVDADSFDFLVVRAAMAASENSRCRCNFSLKFILRSQREHTR